MERKAWPYLAGLIDSEGSILIGKTNGSFYSKVKIVNTDKRLMRWLIQNFGNVYSKYERDGNRRTLYTWQCYAHQQEALLLGVLPYLLNKKHQALTCLEFHRTENSGEKEKLLQHIQDLNQRRIVKQTPFKVNRNKDAYKYAAAYMDGDGCFSFSFDNHSRITIVSRDFIIIKWFLANFGGKFYTYPKVGNNSEHYRWYLNGRKNKQRFLLGLIPYLELKKRQAIIFLEIAKLRSADPYNKDHDESVDKAISAFKAELTLLNSRGSIQTTNTCESSEEISGDKKESRLIGDDKSTSLVIEKV
jgi:hypothetical protein